MDLDLGQRILSIRERVVSNFTHEHWQEIGLLTGFAELINRHQRLLRSLSWGDEDYSGNVLSVLQGIASQNEATLDVFENYLDSKFESETHYISAKPSDKKITFSPSVFDVPNTPIERDLVAVMMPFDVVLNNVYATIQNSCTHVGYRALRADNIWENSTIIQDIFSLIFRSSIVVVDFTGKNPNVMYETGIAHTLGKLVIPISQSIDDVPFDMRHHRVLTYLNNNEGLQVLANSLVTKLGQISA
jgi:AbiJ N-terminal domain 5